MLKVKQIYRPIPRYHRFLELTLSLPCATRCEYCPQDKIPTRFYGQMLRADFEKLLEHLPGSPVRRIDFSGMGEPFQHPDFPDFLVRACRAGYGVVVYTTGKGAGLKDFDFLRRQISNYPVDFYFTPVCPDHEQRKGMTRAESMRIRELFLSQVRPPWTYHEVRVGEPPWGTTISRSGNLGKAPCQVPADIPVACGKQWANVVMPTGDVITCCQDYAGENVFGNIFQDSYPAIRRGPAMLDFLARMAGLVEDPNLICRRCEHRYGTRHVL